MTFTFQWFASPEEAVVDFRQWYRAIARYHVRDHVHVLWAVERDRRGAPHVHALLAVPDPRAFEPGRAVVLWREMSPAHGRQARMERYRRHGGAVAYLVKRLDWQGPDVACPRAKPACRRPRGCVVARAASRE